MSVNADAKLTHLVVAARSLADAVRLESRAWTVFALGCLGFFVPAVLVAWGWLAGIALLLVNCGLPLWAVVHERRCETVLRHDGLFAVRRGGKTLAGRRDELEVASYDAQHKFLNLRDVEFRCKRSHQVIRCEGLRPLDAVRLCRTVRRWGATVYE